MITFGRLLKTVIFFSGGGLMAIARDGFGES